MKLNNRLREKRKLLGLTQEQVAKHLGISAPAVNKWEKGLSFPDITLLPMLARLLKTDPNTLLCFNEKLSDVEIGAILNQVSETIRNVGFEEGYSSAMEQLKEYPHCDKLKYNLALSLKGALFLSNQSTDGYDDQIIQLFEEVAECEDITLAQNARYMLAAKHLNHQEYDKAQTLLDLIPEKSTLPNKLDLQVNLLSMQGKHAAAAVILERMLLQTLQENLIAVTKLIPILVLEGKLEQATQLANASQLQQKSYGLWNYNAALAPMQLAISIKSIPSSIATIRDLLEACVTPWEPSNSPLYSHQTTKENQQPFGISVLHPIITELENSSEYHFLHSSSEFLELLAEYKRKLI